MTVVTTRPTTPSSNAGVAVTGAATIHAALSDSSDSSYGTWSTGDLASVTFPSPTLPSGSLIKSVSVRARSLRTTAGTAAYMGAFDSVRTIYFAITWSTATTTTLGFPATTTPITYLRLFTQGTGAAFVFHELYVDTMYVAKPVVNVTAPVSPVTNTNLPTIEWENTLDPDGGPQAYYHVRVFNDAQYTAPGFDPLVEDNFVGSGHTVGSATSWQVDETLPDDDYRAYVYVAQDVNGAQFWSDPGTIDFTIAVDAPAVPLLTATADPDQGRIILELDDQPDVTSTDLFELQRSLDGGATWEPVRLTTDTDGEITPVSGAATVYDYEAPNGVATSYRARALHSYSGVYAASDWATETATWSSGACWLKQPTDPSVNATIEIVSYSQTQRAARQGVFQPLGATVPIVVSDTRAGATGPLIIATSSAAERTALDALIDANTTLLLQVPAAADEPDRYIRLGDIDRQRGIDKSFATTRNDTLTWIEVAQPAGVVVAWP